MHSRRPRIYTNSFNFNFTGVLPRHRFVQILGRDLSACPRYRRREVRNGSEDTDSERVSRYIFRPKVWIHWCLGFFDLGPKPFVTILKNRREVGVGRNVTVDDRKEGWNDQGCRGKDQRGEGVLHVIPKGSNVGSGPTVWQGVCPTPRDTDDKRPKKDTLQKKEGTDRLGQVGGTETGTSVGGRQDQTLVSGKSLGKPEVSQRQSMD